MRADSLEDLDNVAPGDAVLGLDVEATPQNKGNLLEPGTYRFELRLVAENSRARSYIVEVWFPGKWFPEQKEMFDKGFKECGSTIDARWCRLEFPSSTTNSCGDLQ